MPKAMPIFKVELERFQEKWNRFSDSEARPNKGLEPGFDFIKIGKALGRGRVRTVKSQRFRRWFHAFWVNPRANEGELKSEY